MAMTPRQVYMGNPATPGYEPDKSDIVDLLNVMQALATGGALRAVGLTLADLPTTGNAVGDTALVLDAGADGGVYRWSGSAWVLVGRLPAILGDDVYAQLAQAWAESPTAPGGAGTKSAKSWAIEAGNILGTLPSGYATFSVAATANGQTDFTIPEYPVSQPGAVWVFTQTGRRLPYGATGWVVHPSQAALETATMIRLAEGIPDDEVITGVVLPLTRAELPSVAWASITSRPIRPIDDFGAVGDYDTDSSAAFAAADAAQAAGTCGPVYIPPGDYYCPEQTYAPVGSYYGPGRVRFGVGVYSGVSTYDDAQMYRAPSVPSPIYQRQHAQGRRGRNTKIGADALPGIDLVGENFNTAIGDRAGAAATYAKRSTIIGTWAALDSLSLEYADVIGSSAGQYLYGNRTLLLGNNAGKWMGSQNPVTQRHDFWNLGSDIDDPADDEPQVWSNKGFENIMPFVRRDYLDGDVATVYSNPLAPAAGEIVSMGNVNPALLAAATDEVRGNMAAGRDALIHLLKGVSSTALGYKSLAQAIDATRTTALGRSSGEMGLWHSDDVFVGNNAGGRAISTKESVVVGSRALTDSHSINDTVAVGHHVGALLGRTQIPDKDTYTVSRATLLGSRAAYQADTATNSIVIGYRAGDAVGLDLNNHLFIGSGSSSAEIAAIGGLLTTRQVAINRNVASALSAQFTVNFGAEIGVSPNVSARGILIEGDADTGLTIATPNTANGNIFFADPDDNNAGGIQYNHATNQLLLRAGDDWRVTVKSNTLNLASIPTSATGLVAGDLWNDGGSVRIVT
jgi:hypothetical protein